MSRQDLDTNKCPTCRSHDIVPHPRQDGLWSCKGCGAALVRSKRETAIGEVPYFIHPDRAGQQVFTTTSGLPRAGEEGT